MKRLLVLGATPFQVPIVKKAQARGYYVITMDNIPDNFAHRVSDETSLVSIVERENVLEFAVNARIDGILTGGSDVGVASIGHVCDRLGLPGVTFGQATTLTRKDLFRKFQQENSLSHPDFEVFSDSQAFFERVRSLSGRYMIKPVDSSGSKGASEIELPFQGPEEELRFIFENAMEYTRVGNVLLEDFLNAEEHGGDAFVSDGSVVSMFVTTKQVTGYPHYVPIGHVIPTTLSAEVHRNIRNELEFIVRSLGISHGPINFDVMIDKDGKATILEMSPRFGGNCIPQIIEYGAGFDEIGATIDCALDGSTGKAESKALDEIKPTGARILGARRTGRLKSITPRQEVLEAFDKHLLELVYDVKQGYNVSEFIQGNLRIGHYIATAESLEELDVIMKQVEEKIRLDV
jgi:biotin carboxylase